MRFFTYKKDLLKYERFNFFKIKYFLYFIVFQIILISYVILILSSLYNSPKEKILQKDIQYLTQSFKNVNKRLIEAEFVLNQVKENNNIIYKTIFDTTEISVKKFEISYEELNINNYSKLVEEINTKLSKIEEKIARQEYYLIGLKKTANFHQIKLIYLPAIQPIDNKDLKRTASGWGYRIDPIYKIRKFHYGLDFSAPVGTPIYATGNGIIESVLKESESKGYGNVIIINHLYGYKTLYGHMSKFNVKKGNKIKRGDIIGFVGNTGKSTGPHLHYEVIKEKVKVNPINYLFNSLTPEEFEEIKRISNTIQKSYD
jgi:murein DD-endopeptidase MepM/ murein hydrolase activator NlpD